MTNTPLQRCREQVLTPSNVFGVGTTDCLNELPCPDHPSDRVEEQPQPERCARTIDYDSFGLRIPCDNDLPCVKHPASDADNIADLQSRLTAAMELLARCDRVRVQGQPVLPLALREEIAALSNTKKEEA